MKELQMRNITTTYIIVCPLMRTINHKINILKYKNPRTRPHLIQIMQWHDRWRPHASQWPKPAYHYYRRFVRGFSEMACPLTAMTRAGVEWDWSEAQHQAFNRLKLALTIAPVLKLPDFKRQFVVTTDASDAAVGAILKQDFSNGLQPVAFASRKLNDAEIRYSAYERELLGIVWALAQWKHYCRGASCRNYSDEPCSASSPPKSGKRQFQNLEVDQCDARVQPGDPSYPR